MSRHSIPHFSSFLGPEMPSSPLEGDMWLRGDTMYVCINGVAVKLVSADTFANPNNLPSEDMLKAVCGGD